MVHEAIKAAIYLACVLGHAKLTRQKGNFGVVGAGIVGDRPVTLLGGADSRLWLQYRWIATLGNFP